MIRKPQMRNKPLLLKVENIPSFMPTTLAMESPLSKSSAFESTGALSKPSTPENTEAFTESSTCLDAQHLEVEIEKPKIVAIAVDTQSLSSILNEDLTYEESEGRLIKVLATLAVICLTIATVFLSIVLRLYGRYTTPKVLPFIETSSDSFPSQKIAFSFSNGSVYEANINWHRQSLSDVRIQFLFNIPSPTWYHGYSDETGVLHFVDSEMKRPFLKFSKKFKNGVVTRPLKTDIDSPRFRSSVRIGRTLWLYHSDSQHGEALPLFLYSSSDVSPDTSRLHQTTIWSMKKERYFTGPENLSFLLNSYPYEFCPVPLNASHVLLANCKIGKYHIEKYQNSHCICNKPGADCYGAVMIVDFMAQTFVGLKNRIPVVNGVHYQFWRQCVGAVFQDKHGKQTIWLQLNKWLTVGPLTDDAGFNALMSYDLSKGLDQHWQVQFFKPISSDDATTKKLVSFKGNLVSVMEDGTFVLHQASNSWTVIHNATSRLFNETIQQVVQRQN